MKRIVVTAIFIVATLFFLKKTDYKIQNNGNNISSKTAEENILNMSYYKAQIEVTTISNKNTNKYIMNQEYSKDNYCMQEVLEPENIAGVRFNYRDNTLTVENTKLNLQTIYENYTYIEANSLFLSSFVEEYNQDENAKREEKDDEIILEANAKEQNKYRTKKRLYINKKTGNPTKLEVQDITQNISVYILYNEIEIN